MRRVASLDLLRGVAALSVAIPHYLTLNSNDHRAADVLAIPAVEVFFVLSGFVLAPQILNNVIGNGFASLRVFLIRRWMRTIPPYLIALVFISYITGQLATFDFVRYSMYVQNLLFQANTNDYYPVAWSLSVEEWYYITFAPLLFAAATICRRSDQSFAALYAVCFILMIVILRAWSDPAHWDADVRRVTVFRIDSIAFGFLLYLAFQKFSDFKSPARPYGILGIWLVLAAVCGSVGAMVTYGTMNDNSLSKQLFPFVAAAVGISAIGLFRSAEFLFSKHALVSEFADYAGRISYSIYLFHLVLAMIMKPKLEGLGMTWQLLIYTSCLGAFCLVFWRYFEKPILAARPRYQEIGTAKAVVAQVAKV